MIRFLRVTGPSRAGPNTAGADPACWLRSVALCILAVPPVATGRARSPGTARPGMPRAPITASVQTRMADHQIGEPRVGL